MDRTHRPAQRRARLSTALAVSLAVLAGGAQSAQAADPVIGAAGDIACGVGSSGGCQQMATSNLLVNQGLAAVLPLGDLQYDCMTPADLAVGYDPSWGRVKPITKPIPGNHDYRKNCDEFAAGYMAYFSGIGLPPAATDPTKGYYSYNIGDWHIVALNTGENCSAVSCANGSAQVNWLKADLADPANQRTCTLAYFHYPRFSSNTPLPSFTQPFWDALYNRGVDVVMSGHVHHYERFAPQTPSGAPDAAYGIRQFNVGTGGKSLEGFDKNTPLDPSDPLWDPLGPPEQFTYAPNSQARISAYGVVKLTLGAGSYGWQFVNTSGNTLDSGTADCHGPPGNADTSPPTVSITSPAKNATVFNTVAVTASAGDNVSVGSVRFFVDGKEFGAPDIASPYSANLNTRTLANGTHTLTAVAMDTSGNQTTSASRQVTVDNDLVAPTVALTSPTANALVKGIWPLGATATDNPGGTGVARVEFLVDGAVIATDTTAPYTPNWNTTGVSDGRHTVAARAIDARGNVSTTTQRSVVVRNVTVAGPGATSIARIGRTSTVPAIIAAPVAGSLADPAVSHRRTRVAFTSPDGIVVAGIDGSNPIVVPGTVGAQRPGWVRGDGALVYVSGGAVFRRNLDGSGRRRLARGRIGSLAVSPNGRRVAFQRVMASGRTDIFVISIDGGTARNVTASRLVGEVDPAWRDNATIAYAVRAGKWRIFTVAAAGGTPRAASAKKFDCRQPAFATDGRTLACMRQVDATHRAILVLARPSTATTMGIPTAAPSRPAWIGTGAIAYVTP